jgi:cyanophycin synthetase
MANSITRDLIIAEAQRRGFEVETIGNHAYFCKVTAADGRTEIFHGSRPMHSSAHGYEIASDKDLSMQFMQSLGYSMPDYATCLTLEDAKRAQTKLGTVVVKPNDGLQSIGVTVGVSSEASLEAAYKKAVEGSLDKKVIVQEQLQGRLYRVLVINGTFVAAAYKTAPEIRGDGTSTVAELIRQFNADTQRGETAGSVLRIVKPEVVASLYTSNVLQVVLAKGEALTLGVESISAGGQAVDVTKDVHELWKKVCERISTEAGLFINGIDIMCADIASPPPRNKLPILELNHMPGLGTHHYPTGGGTSIDVTKMLFDQVFA